HRVRRPRRRDPPRRSDDDGGHLLGERMSVVAASVPAPSTRQRGRYRVLLAYARPYRRGWATIVLVTLATTGLGLLTPWPMKILVDNVLGRKGLPSPLDRLPATSSPHWLLLWVVGAT